MFEHRRSGDVTARSEEEGEMKSCEGAGRHREEMVVLAAYYRVQNWCYNSIC